VTGRPTKYSPETAERILSALKAGNTLRASAKYVGISEDTLLAWRHRFSAFSAQIDRAEGEAEVLYVAVIAEAARDGDWRAAITWLERRRHDDWRERKTQELTGPGGGPIQTEDVGLNDDDRATRILAIVQRARERTPDAADAATADLDPAAGSTD